MERRNENRFGLLSKRIERGLAILDLANQINEIEPNKWRVKSQSSGRSYIVTKKNGEWHCTCPDHHYRKIECEHIHSVENVFLMLSPLIILGMIIIFICLLWGYVKIYTPEPAKNQRAK